MIANHDEEWWGQYAGRLKTQTEDELAEIVDSMNKLLSRNNTVTERTRRQHKIRLVELERARRFVEEE